MKETDLRYVKTERAIRDAFFELLEESDFDKVSVTDITQRAQINRNTFYLHYSDKFNLVNSILIDFVQELSQQALKVIDQAEKPDTATFNQYFLTIFVSPIGSRKNIGSCFAAEILSRIWILLPLRM